MMQKSMHYTFAFENKMDLGLFMFNYVKRKITFIACTEISASYFDMAEILTGVIENCKNIHVISEAAIM